MLAQMRRFTVSNTVIVVLTPTRAAFPGQLLAKALLSGRMVLFLNLGLMAALAQGCPLGAVPLKLAL